ncbi:MAG TPA: hypothetical protein VFU13_21150 [Steroidobacteraceae bacterium]|nr:hypothetical protein [Steroidobacteraceae bacterium]
MKVKTLLPLMLLLVACDRQVAPAAPEPGKPAQTPEQAAPVAAAQTPQEFWSGFRVAALADDRASLQDIARFPFVTRGTTDDDANISHDEAAFAGLIPKIFAQDTGLSSEGETVRQYIERHPELPPIATGGGQSVPVEQGATQFAAGPLNFEKVGNRWYWVSAYLE